MIRKYLQKYFAKLFYPTQSEDWYLSKGYIGNNEQDRFEQFLLAQRTKGAIFYKEFKSLDYLTRQFIKSGNDKLDSVIIMPNKSDISIEKKRDLYFVFFQGRGEFYESRFRDMAICARETRAAVIGFNPKGFKSSTGRTENIFDLVDDGIAVIKYLLDQMNLSPNRIILQGNSLGAGVQEMVSEHFRELYGYRFRQINSNSFNSLAAVLAYNYSPPFFAPFVEKLMSLILIYANWEIIPGEDFYQTGIYRCHLRRLNDRTLALKAEYHAYIDIEKDCAIAPIGYLETNRWLYNNCQIVYNGSSETDPHFLSLNLFDLVGDKGKNKNSIYKLINHYISQSEKYIRLNLSHNLF